MAKLIASSSVFLRMEGEMRTIDAEMPGKVLGLVFVIMGVGTGNSGIRMLGGVFPAIGFWAGTGCKKTQRGKTAT